MKNNKINFEFFFSSSHDHAPLITKIHLFKGKEVHVLWLTPMTDLVALQPFFFKSIALWNKMLLLFNPNTFDAVTNLWSWKVNSLQEKEPWLF